MALTKTYMTPKGYSSYWIAGIVQIDNYNKTAYARLYGFVNKEHCDLEGSVPVILLDYNITPDIYDFYFAKEIMAQPEVTPQTQAYQIFKDFNIKDANGEIFNFSDATDEIEGVQ
jgi:hypothetical protein